MKKLKKHDKKMIRRIFKSHNIKLKFNTDDEYSVLSATGHFITKDLRYSSRTEEILHGLGFTLELPENTLGSFIDEFESAVVKTGDKNKLAMAVIREAGDFNGNATAYTDYPLLIEGAYDYIDSLNTLLTILKSWQMMKNDSLSDEDILLPFYENDLLVTNCTNDELDADDIADGLTTVYSIDSALPDDICHDMCLFATNGTESDFIKTFASILLNDLSIHNMFWNVIDSTDETDILNKFQAVRSFRIRMNSCVMSLPDTV